MSVLREPRGANAALAPDNRLRRQGRVKRSTLGVKEVLLPGKILALVIFRTMKQFGTIRSARQATSVALSSASRALEQEALGALRVIAADPNLGEILGVESAVAEKMGGWHGISQIMVSSQKVSAQMVLDAACLVFAHSVFDAALLECCRAAAIARPADWEQFVKKREFAISALKEQGYESILQSAIDIELRRLDRESALAKVDRLLSLCRPGREILTSPILKSGVHGFSRERLTEIDQARHDIVHGKGPRQLENLDDDITYLEATAFRMMSAVMHHYEVRPDGAVLLAAFNDAYSKGDISE